jgi:mRNA interferase MazF
MVRRGEIYYVDWSPGRGSEQAGTRPALIIQNDVGNQFGSTTIVAAISTRQTRAYPFQVAVTTGESGLPRDSIVKCEQIQTIDQTRLGRLVGALEAEKVTEVDFALQRSLGLET